MKKKSYFFICIILVAKLVIAQPSVYKMKDNTTTQTDVQVRISSPVLAGIRFGNNALTQQNALQWLAEKLQLRTGADVLKSVGTVAHTPHQIKVSNWAQYYKGIKVEHGTIHLTSSYDKVIALNMEFYSVPTSFNIRPVLADTEALQVATAAMEIPDSLMGRQAQRPTGELVIISTYLNDSSVCLAWKFVLINSQKMAMAKVYVDAQTGRVVLKDTRLRFANAQGTATTRTSGTQTIITDNGSTDAAKPFRLRQSRNGHNIITLNYQSREWNKAQNDPLAIDFTDNDNNWQASEFANATKDDAALDVHLHMQIISDYWKTVHNRNSWDDNNSEIKSFVHVKYNCGGTPVIMDNAFWDGTAMNFGDGTYGTTGVGSACKQEFRPVVTLDVAAHEFGHGITEATCNLVFQKESGALNEGFSDIWAAAIEKWAVDQNPTIGTDKKNWIIAEQFTKIAGKGFRDMQTPGNFNNPSTYKDSRWDNAAAFNSGCTPSENNDECGVHNNSGVFNKWFYLITVGEAGANTLGMPYNVAGMGFTKSSQLAYLTTLNLTPNAGYATAKDVSMEAATTLFGIGSAEVETVRAAWRAVGVDSAIFDMTNTAAFATGGTQSFLSIGLGKNNTVWAGTDKKGLYVYDGTHWTQRSEINNVRINDIKTDANGGIWIAQSGTVNSGLATAGGVNYFANPALPMTGFYTIGAQANVPSRNVKSIFIDNSRKQSGTNPRVWMASSTYTNSAGNSAPGRLGLGLNATTPSFTSITAGMQANNTVGGVTAVGGDKNTIWTFAPDNNNHNQILQYNAGTGALIAAYDNAVVDLIPANFSVTAIYTDKHKFTWFGLTTNAVLVANEYGAFRYISFPSIFPAGSKVNANAIAGSPYGDVYIGTTAGLVFFDKLGNLESANSYHLYKKANGLPSNNITGIAYDKVRFKVWLASDQGVCSWDPICLGNSCNLPLTFTNPVTSIASGNWSDSSTWENNIIPDSTMHVLIEDSVVVDVNSGCQSLSVLPGGKAIIKPNIQLKIYAKEQSTIISIGRRTKDE
jgi:Zn-dependent metalloprotease